MSEFSRTLLYGLLAAASPVTLLAALASLGSGRGRSTGLAFAGAFVLGQAAASFVAFCIGASFTEDDHSTAVALIELVLGAALLVVARRGGTVLQPRQQAQPARTEALFGRLEQTGPAVAFGVGLPLGIGAKRLAITIVAAGTVGVAGSSHAANFALGVMYVLVASMVVWLPVLLYLLLGARADVAVPRARAWIVTNERALTFWSAIVLGAFLILDGLIHLLA